MTGLLGRCGWSGDCGGSGNSRGRSGVCGNIGLKGLRLGGGLGQFGLKQLDLGLKSIDFGRTRNRRILSQLHMGNLKERVIGDVYFRLGSSEYYHQHRSPS